MLDKPAALQNLITLLQLKIISTHLLRTSSIMSAPAAAAKKGKKKGKAKTVSLNDFLGDAQGPGIVKKIDWADEADEDFRSVNSSLTYQSTSAPKVIQLPTAPRAARSVEIDHSRIPETGPFTAFLGNLPYEINEYVLQEFFKGLPIVNVRLPEENGRFKGFGYVQFNDKQSLIKALEMNEETLQKRNIRIDVADNQNKDSGNNWRQGGERRESGPDPTEGNWRQAAADESARQAAEYQDKRDASYGSNSLWDQRHRSRDHGERYDPQRQHAGFSRRQHFDYKGSYRNDSYESGGYRKSSQGYDQYDRRYNDRSGYGSRGYNDRRDDNRSRYNDRSGYDRDSYSHGSYNRQRSDDSFGSRRDEPPRERPQLQLKPRQKPLEDDTAVTRSSSIFGAAKPVDTAAKEREIEEKIYSKQRSVEEPQVPEKKSSNIFGGAKPIDTSAREREIEKKISEQKERLLSASKASAPEPPPSKSSVFGDAKPVDTAARELEIEEKIRKREQEYSSASLRDEKTPGRHSRISSERSDDLAPSSPRRRSRTSSAKSSEDHPEPALSQKSSDSDIRKPEFKPAPIPKQNAWGRKPLAMDKPASTQEEVSGPGREEPSSTSTAWNRGPQKPKSGVREEAEGDSKEDEEEARRPEGASNEDESMQNRNEPGDGSEEGKQAYSSSSSSYRPYRPKSDANYNSYQSRREPDQGGRHTSNRSRNYDADAYRGNRNDGYRDDRRSGDGDSHACRSNRGYTDDRGSSRSQPDSGSRPKNRNDWNEKKRDSSRDSRPECDRPDGAGQEQSSSNTRPSKLRTKQMPTLETEAPVQFAKESKFALLAIDDGQD